MNNILELLIVERARIDQVIQILSGSAPKKRGRPRKDSLTASEKARNQHRESLGLRAKRVFSKETRERMAAAQQKRWKGIHAERRKSVKAQAKKASKAKKAAKIQARAKDTSEKAA